MPLLNTLTVDQEQVAAIVKEHYGLQLGTLVKASQNSTFLAFKKEDSLEQKLIVRVTPEPEPFKKDHIEVELDILQYLHQNGLPVSTFLPNLSGKSFVEENNWIVVVFYYSKGEPLAFSEWRWINEEKYVVGLGNWFAQLHRLLKKYQTLRPEMISKIPYWTSLHDKTLEGYPVSDEDLKKESDPEQFGIIHGDVNISNFFWNHETNLPEMFDFDQIQRSWYLYDLTAPIWTVFTLKYGGNPVDQSPVPNFDIPQYVQWILKGYETEGNKVDIKDLSRMMLIRKELYVRFCRRAVEELSKDSPIRAFCVFMNNWIGILETENPTMQLI